MRAVYVVPSRVWIGGDRDGRYAEANVYESVGTPENPVDVCIGVFAHRADAETFVRALQSRP